MTYWTKNIYTGQVYKGKASSWKEVSATWFDGDRLYNPYSGETVWGWNAYKESMRRSWEKRQAHKKK